MRPLWKALPTLLMGLLLAGSCFDPPVYSEVPAIQFEKIEFVDITDPSTADSLILTLSFKDGDGDLGLDAEETAPPFNDKYYVLNTTSNTLVNYKDKRTNPDYDTLPDFTKPFNCINWEITTINSVTDTLYFQLNPNHYNIFVDFLVKNELTGNFTEFDWQTEFTYPNCGIPFDGRFPILSKDLSKKIPLDGTIKYGMTSTGFLILFSIKTLKLRITVQDRALHKSNVIETKEFTLQDIRRGG